MLFYHATLRKFINPWICNAMWPYIQCDLVPDPDAPWSRTEVSYRPRPRRHSPQNQDVTQSWTQIGHFADESKILNPTRNRVHRTTRQRAVLWSNPGNVIHPSLYLGKQTLQLYSSTGNHRVNKSPGVPPKNFGKQILPTLHTIQFWILPHAQFRQKFLTLLLQQTRATTPFQRAGLIPQFAKCPNSHKHNFASV